MENKGEIQAQLSSVIQGGANDAAGNAAPSTDSRIGQATAHTPGNEVGTNTAFSRQSNASFNQTIGAQLALPVKEVDATPRLIRSLLFDEAQQLATMPRQKLSDFAQAALWSALTSITGAGAGIMDLLAKEPAQPKLIDLLEVGIFIACGAFAVQGLVSSRETRTAGEYLNELFNLAK